MEYCIHTSYRRGWDIEILKYSPQRFQTLQKIELSSPGVVPNNLLTQDAFLKVYPDCMPLKGSQRLICHRLLGFWVYMEYILLLRLWDGIMALAFYFGVVTLQQQFLTLYSRVLNNWRICILYLKTQLSFIIIDSFVFYSRQLGTKF